ncbi:MAG: hypothetical protein NTW87_31995 [Planctomycetota bacterium]|nr:hypothetical protein [Planctomycetota bacterium]
MAGLDGTWLVLLVILGAIVLFFFVVVGLPVWLYHRREVLRMKGLARNETAAVSQRVTALESRCDTLEERVTEAHVLLADEQRQMDRRLAAMLPDDAVSPDGSQEEAKRRRGERKRTT